MKSHLTSYDGLFGRDFDATPRVDRVQIPLIQRDYAQGRSGEERVRRDFLDVLHRAVTLGERVGLDFVYGEVQGNTLLPLDGQQRLTTLFLLHWFLAACTHHLDEDRGWKNFTYATRPSAEMFCNRLTKHALPGPETAPGQWIRDQPWYLFTWRHDPTIQSMLTMLDAIQERFKGAQHAEAWERLVAPQDPAITFHLLPMEGTQQGEDLYIKMNSRGKPLTVFENFKARFLQTVEESCPERVTELSEKVDGAWSDLLWRVGDGDGAVDDEFLRYFRFATEIAEWHAGRLVDGDTSSLAESVYAIDSPNPAAQIDFLIRAFDVWVSIDAQALFDKVFADQGSSVSEDESRVVLFGQDGASRNLFFECCQRYGEMSGRIRQFNLQVTLHLYGALLHLLHESKEYARRARTLRNLIEASSNELREDRMPDLVADVSKLIVHGSLANTKAFNKAAVADEQAKQSLLESNPGLAPALFALEDHDLLRGCLFAFDLDASRFEKRATSFASLFERDWAKVTGGLLAMGDYSKSLNWRDSRLGSAKNDLPWRDLLTGGQRQDHRSRREVLGNLLDAVAAGDDVDGTLDEVQRRWLAAREEKKVFDWRYYLVRYPAMREGLSGIYAGLNNGAGYEVCMLDKRYLNSRYRDPYLWAMFRESGVGKDVLADPRFTFTGAIAEPRWLLLAKSSAGLRCVPEGILVRPPSGEDRIDVFERLRQKWTLEVLGDSGAGDLLLRVSQTDVDGTMFDAEDRVQIGQRLLRDLIECGL